MNNLNIIKINHFDKYLLGRVQSELTLPLGHGGH